MCEFKVLLNGKTICEDVIYAKSEENRVILKDILGGTKIIKNCKIAEVDVGSEKLLLASI